jgi:hypothetical protein
MLNWLKQQHGQEFSKQLFRGKEAIFRAASNYEFEARIYEKARAIFLAERAKSNKEWCSSRQRSI